MRRIPMVLALAVATLGADSARAQIPGLGDAARVLDRVPSLSSFLEGDPPITTSLDDARTEIAFLDAWTPTGWQRLDDLPRTGDGAFRLRPGRFAMEAQSYCMHAGTHGPGGGDGYLYAPLAGSKAEIVQSLLRNSVAHPEIPQRDIQVLIWAIIARTEFDEMPSEMQRTARSLLTRDQVDDLDDGALGEVPESVMREAMNRLPPVAQQVFRAEAQLRSMISSGTSSFASLERVAVLTGAVEPPEGSRPVPVGRWSFDPDGYFVRYDPSGYSQTRVEVSVPVPVAIARDAAGRIVGVYGRYGQRLEHGEAGVRFARSRGDAGETVLSTVPGSAGQPGAPVARVLAEVLGSGQAPAVALRDLADLETLARSLQSAGVAVGDGETAPGGSAGDVSDALTSARAGALDLVVEAWQAAFCAAAGCPGFAPAGDVLVLRSGATIRGELEWCFSGTCLFGNSPFGIESIAWIGLARTDPSPPPPENPDAGEVHRVDGTVRPGDLVSLGDDLVLTDTGGHDRPDVTWIHLVGAPEEPPQEQVGGAPEPDPAPGPGPTEEEEDPDDEEPDDDQGPDDQQFDGPVYDPSDDVATPGNRGRQRLAQSSRPTGSGGAPPGEEDDDCAGERRNFEQADAIWGLHFDRMQALYNQIVSQLGIETIAAMENYSGPGESMVYEYLEMDVEGRELLRAANEAMEILEQCEAAAR